MKIRVLLLALVIGPLSGCSYLVDTTFFNNTGDILQVDWEGKKATISPGQSATIVYSNGNRDHMVRLISGGCEYQYEVPENVSDYRPDKKLERGVQIQVEKDFSIDLLPASYAGDGPASGDVILKHEGFPLRPVIRKCPSQG